MVVAIDLRGSLFSWPLHAVLRRWASPAPSVERRSVRWVSRRTDFRRTEFVKRSFGRWVSRQTEFRTSALPPDGACPVKGNSSALPPDGACPVKGNWTVGVPRRCPVERISVERSSSNRVSDGGCPVKRKFRTSALPPDGACPVKGNSSALPPDGACPVKGNWTVGVPSNGVPDGGCPVKRSSMPD